MDRPDVDRPDGSHSALFVLTLLPVLGSVLVVSTSGLFVTHEALLVAVLLVGGSSWILATHLARRGVGDLGIVVAGAIALRVVAWSGNPGFSDDAYRYLWEGEVVIAGASPYAAAPEEVSAGGIDAPAGLRRQFPELWARVNHKGVRAAYPPLAQSVGAAVAALCRGFDAKPETTGIQILRAFFGACDLLVLWPLTRILRRARLPGALAVVWGWCPLAALEFAGAGHLDSLGILLLVGALAADSTPKGSGSRRELATGFGLAPWILLSAAILTKYLPVVALPWFLRGKNALGKLAGFLVLCAAGFAPVLLLRGGAHGLFSGLGEYAFRWDSGSLVHRWIEPLFSRGFARDESWSDPRRLARCSEAMLWLAFAWTVVRRESDRVRGTGALIGAWLVLSPTLHPWYLCWMIPFLAIEGGRAWMWLILSAPLLYWPLERWQSEGVWSEPAWLWPAIALPFFGLLLLSWVERARRRDG